MNKSNIELNNYNLNNKLNNKVAKNNLENAQKNNLVKKNLNTNCDKEILNNSFLYSSSLTEVPVSISIELGKKKITIKELLRLSKGSIIELEDKVDEPLNIFVNSCLVALGELVVQNEKYGVRIIKII